MIYLRNSHILTLFGVGHAITISPAPLSIYSFYPTTSCVSSLRSASKLSIVARTMSMCSFARDVFMDLARVLAVLTVFLICRPLISTLARSSKTLGSQAVNVCFDVRLINNFHSSFRRSASRAVYFSARCIRDLKARSKLARRLVVRKRIPS